ncbi:hypothetical protein [Bacillus sp. BC08]
MDVLIFIIALSVFLFVVFAIIKMFIAIGLMVLEMIPFIYHRFNETVGTPFNPVRFLAVIAVAFLIILSTNKRKYGDS